MHYLIFPQKDSWIYSKYPNYNNGLDEILEIKKEITDTTVDYSRVLIQFDTSSFPTAAIQSGSFYLNLYAANPLKLPSDYTIDVYPISQSWAQGTGYPSSNIQKEDGVTWNTRSTNSNWNNSGSDYISTISCSQGFSYNVADIRIDVTSIVKSWISGTFPNYGFLVKRAKTEETSSLDEANLTFYSMDTHTVNLPILEAMWDDSIFITGSTQLIYSGNVQGYMTDGTMSGIFSNTSGHINTSSFSTSYLQVSSSVISSSNMVMTGSFSNVLSGSTFQPVTTDELSISMRNLKKEYKYATDARMRIFSKDLYQRKTFTNTNALSFSIIKYLPQNSAIYQIEDAYTGRIIIPFSQYTKIGCDSLGNYFDLNLNGFMPNRFYRIIFKVTLDGSDSYFDNNYIFKVIK